MTNFEGTVTCIRRNCAGLIEGVFGSVTKSPRNGVSGAIAPASLKASRYQSEVRAELQCIRRNCAGLIEGVRVLLNFSVLTRVSGAIAPASLKGCQPIIATGTGISVSGAIAPASLKALKGVPILITTGVYPAQLRRPH